jgi:S-adenosylmethionine/arginine decarboxylase-like enzyme
MRYGYELVLDLHDCDPRKFTPETVEIYFRDLCDKIGMKRYKCYFWSASELPIQAVAEHPHIEGMSAVQFILTSSITVHTSDHYRSIYINVFSCKHFDPNVAQKFSVEFFDAKQIVSRFYER